MLSIDRDIPIPPPAKGTAGARTNHGRIAREMKVGESVFSPDPDLIEGIRRIIYDLGGKVMRRKRFEKTKEYPEGIWGVRIWRTE